MARYQQGPVAPAASSVSPRRGSRAATPREAAFGDRSGKAPGKASIRAVRFDGADFAVIVAAAKHQAQPVSVFIRSAALREARRVLQSTEGAAA